MLLPLSIDGSLAILPALADHFGSRASVVQLTLSAAVAGIAAGQLVHGPLSDAFGRKPVILGGLLAYLAATLACAAAASVETLIGFRFLQGFAACSGVIVARAVIRDLFDDADGTRLFALMMGIHGVMPMLAPGLSGWINGQWGWRAVFAAMAGFGILVTLAVLSGLRETRRPRDRSRIRVPALAAGYRRILSNRAFGANAVCSCFLYASLFAYFAAAPTILIRGLGLGPAEFGVAMAAPMLVYVVAQTAMTRLALRTSFDRMIRIGIGTGITAGASLLFFAASGTVNVYTLVGPIAFSLIAHSFIVPAVTTGAIVPFADAAGAASSLLGFLQFLAAAAAAAIVGLLDDGTPMPMAAGICLCAFGTLWTYAALIRRLPRDARP